MKDNEIKRVRRYSKEDLVGLVKTVGYDKIKGLGDLAPSQRLYEVSQIVSIVDSVIEQIDVTDPPMDGALVSVGPPNFSNELMEAYEKGGFGWS